jgi:hypothetical protein
VIGDAGLVRRSVCRVCTYETLMALWCYWTERHCVCVMRDGKHSEQCALVLDGMLLIIYTMTSQTSLQTSVTFSISW